MEETSKVLIGAAIGFGASQLAELINDWRKHRRGVIKEYKRSLFTAEVTVTAGLIMMYNNVDLLAKAAEMSRQGGWMSTLPVTLDFDKEIAHDLHNAELINGWIHLCLQIEMLNQQMVNFKDYYIRTSDEIHTMALHGDKGQDKDMTNSTISHDLETLAEFATSMHDMTAGIIKNALQSYANIYVHAERRQSRKTRINSPKKLGKFEVPAAERKKAFKMLSKKFEDPEKFTRYGSNLPKADK